MTSSVSANPASQLLSALLSQLSASSSSSSSTATTMTMAMAQVTPTAGGSSCNALTGSTTAGLTSETLDALMTLQQLDGSAAGSNSASTSNPMQQLFSAVDSNGDGSVSQTEMESYIEGVGGTQAQADSLYNAISQNGTSAGASSSGISESQMASAASPTQAAQGGGHHHHHRKVQGSGDQADNVANSLLQTLDTNDDGSVGEGEFSNFVTANGGSAAQAASDFSALDTSGSSSLTSADFATAWSNLQAQQTSQSSGTMMVSLLDAFAKANTTTNSTTSVSA
jgi:Ca2+-binding EF-hand superfamily protein